MLPIVMHHGLMGFGEIAVGPLKVSYFGRIGRAIAERGHPMIVSGVHPTAGIATRARQLKETMLRQLDILGRPKNERVIVIAHSMGGLDARYMISKLGMEERVAALLTITSPHRGSPYADWCVKNLGRIGTFRLLSALGLDVQAANDLTTWNCKKFNKQVPDSPKVMYFSVSAARPWRLVPPFALHAYKVVYDAEGDNDSLVSVKSSTWGTHLGVWPADHWHTLNKRFVVEVKHPTGDITPYYLRALDQVLAACGDADPTGRPSADTLPRPRRSPARRKQVNKAAPTNPA